MGHWDWVIGYFKLQKFLSNISSNVTSTDLGIKYPITLVKPFEIIVVPEKNIDSISPDISIYEIVTNDSLIYGTDLRYRLSKKIPTWSALKIALNRLVGLNLCIKLLLTKNVDDKITKSIINYESAKGVMAVLEAIMVITQNYKSTYEQRISFLPNLLSKYPNLYDASSCHHYSLE